MYELNNRFHTENLGRHQDVHQLQTELAETKNTLSGLSAMVTSLLTQTVNGTVASEIMALGQGLSALGATGSGSDCAGRATMSYV